MSTDREQTVSGGRDAIVAEIRTHASPHDAWSAFADADTLARWFVDEAHGRPQPGETMTWIWRAFGVEAPYRVVAAEPGARLVLEAPGDAAPPGLIEITVALEGGHTLVRVVNSGFVGAGLPEDVVEGIRSGWTMALAVLKEYLENYAGQPKRSFLHVHPTTAALDHVRDWFLDAARVAEWLAADGTPARNVGEPFTLLLTDGTRLDGRTLAVTGTELAFAVPEQRAAIELKTFVVPGPDAGIDLKGLAAPPFRTMVAVRGTCWGADAERFERLSATLGQALDRLAARLEGAAAGG